LPSVSTNHLYNYNPSCIFVFLIMDHLHLCTSMHLLTLLFYYYCCCTVCTALLFSYSAIFIAASVRNKLIHSFIHSGQGKYFFWKSQGKWIIWATRPKFDFRLPHEYGRLTLATAGLLFTLHHPIKYNIQYPGNSDGVWQMTTSINEYIKAISGSEWLWRRLHSTAWHPRQLNVNRHAFIITRAAQIND